MCECWGNPLAGHQGHPPSLQQNKRGLNLLLFDVLIAFAVVVAKAP